MKTKSWYSHILVIVFASALLFTTGTANALFFDLSFDNSIDGSVTPPLVGSGNFSFNGDLLDGSYPLDTLTNVVFNATFINGQIFSLIDTEDPLSEVLAVINTVGQNRFLRFGNINGQSGGTINGSFDLFNVTNGFLTFEPGLTGGDLYLSAIINGDNSFIGGNYLAVESVPEPATMLLLGTGLVGVAGAARRRKKNQA